MGVRRSRGGENGSRNKSINGRSIWEWEEYMGMGGVYGNGRSIWEWEEYMGMGGAG